VWCAWFQTPSVSVDGTADGWLDELMLLLKLLRPSMVLRLRCREWWCIWKTSLRAGGRRAAASAPGCRAGRAGRPAGRLVSRRLCRLRLLPAAAAAAARGGRPPRARGRCPHLWIACSQACTSSSVKPIASGE
jgi:hypothetical protein